MQLRLTELDRAGLRRLYPAMRRDFPPAELKPLRRLEKQMRQGDCRGWLIKEGDIPRGYALVQSAPGTPFVLLDYLAVFPQRRGGGYGSGGLALLQEKYPGGILAEVEDEVPGQEGENRVRRRRMDFYRRMGFVPCPFDNSVFGVRYLVHLWTPRPVEDPARQAAEGLLAHYRHQLPGQVCRLMVRVQLPGGERP